MICTLEPKKKGKKDDSNNNSNNSNSNSNTIDSSANPQVPSNNMEAAQSDPYKRMSGPGYYQQDYYYNNIHMSTDAAANQGGAAATAEARLNCCQPRTSVTSLCRDEFGEGDFLLQTIADCGRHLDYYEQNRLRVGIIIHTTESTHRALACLASPASSCRVTALAVLKPPPSFSSNDLNLVDDNDDDDADVGLLTPGSIMRRWMINNNLGNHSESVVILGGEEGAKQIVQREDVDAVFLIVPDEIHRKYALSALGNKKHVLLNDPVSISLQDFNAQLEHAKRNGKFVQSSTAFINQYRVRHFMEAVVLGGSGNDTTTVQSAFTRPFGRVAHMNAHLRVRSADLERVGVTPPPAPLRENEGCIRRLGRYCVLYSILLFTKLGSHPVSVQVHEATVQEVDHARNKGPEKTRREPTSARCTVNYSDDRKLTFDVSYSTASTTRQQLEVKTANCMATMSDFVFPQPDGLATYRRYDYMDEEAKKLARGVCGGCQMEVMRGEAIDIAGGPQHDVMMWRKFAELSRSVDESGWDDLPLLDQVNEVTTITLHTKTILNALMKSFENGFVQVEL